MGLFFSSGKTPAQLCFGLTQSAKTGSSSRVFIHYFLMNTNIISPVFVLEWFVSHSSFKTCFSLKLTLFISACTPKFNSINALMYPLGLFHFASHFQPVLDLCQHFLQYFFNYFRYLKWLQANVLFSWGDIWFRNVTIFLRTAFFFYIFCVLIN